MPDDALYTRIAERFAFELPAEYRQMRARGWMTLDRPAASISTTPGDGYLWLTDMEWYSLEEMTEFEFPEFYQPHLPHLLPFASSGGGDFWCWQTDHTDPRGTRVLLCLHDTQMAAVYAPNFGAALYRQALLYACTYVIGQADDFAEGRAWLRRWSVDLGVAMPAEWCRVIEEIAGRSGVEWTQGRMRNVSLLSEEEMKRIVARDLQFPEMDMEIPWGCLDEV